MASVVGQASAAATSVAIPAHQPGDLILVTARGTVAPVKPTASGTVPNWVTIQSAAQFSIGLTTVGFVATASNHTTGVFTSATHVGVVVIRPATGKTLNIGASSVGGANNQTVVIYPALTLQVVDGSSFGVRIGTRATAASQLGTNYPAGWTEQIEQPVTTPALVVSTRATLLANPTADSVTAGAANAAWRAHTVEIREISQTVYGEVSMAITFSRAISGQRETFGRIVAPFIFGRAISGQRQTFGQIDWSLLAQIDTAGFRVGTTYYGLIDFPITFSKDIRGQRKAFGQLTMPLTFVKDVRGQRKTFGRIDFPIIFTKEAVGRKQAFGQLSMQTLFGKETTGRRKTFGQLALPITFSRIIAGQRTTFGRIALPIGFQAFVDGQVFVGQKTYYGQLVFPIVFDKQVVAYRKTFGKTNSPFIFGSVSQGWRRTFSKIVFPLNFEAAVKSGRIGAHGRIVLPIVIGITTNGRIITAGIILNDALDLYLGEQNIVAAYVGSERVWP